MSALGKLIIAVLYLGCLLGRFVGSLPAELSRPAIQKQWSVVKYFLLKGAAPRVSVRACRLFLCSFIHSSCTFLLSADGIAESVPGKQSAAVIPPMGHPGLHASGVITYLLQNGPLG